jgi:hypothetical protein
MRESNWKRFLTKEAADRKIATNAYRRSHRIVQCFLYADQT